MAIRYKNNGKYAYETHNVWEKELKKYRTEWNYLRIVDPVTKIATPKYKTKTESGALPKGEKLIIDYGNTFVFSEYCRLSGLTELLKSVFGELLNSLLALVFYRLMESGGMNMVEQWYDGNYARICLPGLDLASPRTTDLLWAIGDEALWRDFFKRYTQSVYSNEGVIIDSTGLPNDINVSLTALGHRGGDVEKEIRMIMVVDRKEGDPLYFRYVAGNIVDVSTLKTTINELVAMNIKANYALLDAGYCSEANIIALYKAEISFLMRVPAGRLIYKEAVQKALPSLENGTLYGERILYIKREKVTMYGEYEGYVYVCLDVKKKIPICIVLLIIS